MSFRHLGSIIIVFLIVCTVGCGEFGESDGDTDQERDDDPPADGEYDLDNGTDGDPPLDGDYDYPPDCDCPMEDDWFHCPAGTHDREGECIPDVPCAIKCNTIGAVCNLDTGVCQCPALMTMQRGVCIPCKGSCETTCIDETPLQNGPMQYRWSMMLDSLSLVAMIPDGEGGIYLLKEKFRQKKSLLLSRMNTDGVVLWQAEVTGAELGMSYLLRGPGNQPIIVTHDVTNPGRIIEDGVNDVIIVRFSASGTRLSTKGFGGPLNEMVDAVTADDEGNVTIIGWTHGWEDGPSGDGDAWPDGDLSNLEQIRFMAQIGAQDTVRWKTFFSADGFIEEPLLTSDGEGRVALVATYVGPLDLGGGRLPYFPDYPYSRGTFMATFTSGGEHVATQLLRSPREDSSPLSIRSAVFDKQGRVVVSVSTGSSPHSRFICPGCPEDPFNSMSEHHLLIRVTPNGEVVPLSCVPVCKSSAGHYGWIELDALTRSDGGAGVAGLLRGGTYLAGDGGTASPCNRHLMSAHFREDGSPQWAQLLSSGMDVEEVLVAADPDGELYFAGKFNRHLLFSGAEYYATPGGHFLAKFSLGALPDTHNGPACDDSSLIPPSTDPQTVEGAIQACHELSATYADPEIAAYHAHLQQTCQPVTVSFGEHGRAVVCEVAHRDGDLPTDTPSWLGPGYGCVRGSAVGEVITGWYGNTGGYSEQGNSCHEQWTEETMAFVLDRKQRDARPCSTIGDLQTCLRTHNHPYHCQPLFGWDLVWNESGCEDRRMSSLTGKDLGEARFIGCRSVHEFYFDRETEDGCRPYTGPIRSRANGLCLWYDYRECAIPAGWQTSTCDECPRPADGDGEVD